MISYSTSTLQKCLGPLIIWIILSFWDNCKSCSPLSGRSWIKEHVCDSAELSLIFQLIFTGSHKWGKRVGMKRQLNQLRSDEEKRKDVCVFCKSQCNFLIILWITDGLFQTCEATSGRTRKGTTATAREWGRNIRSLSRVLSVRHSEMYTCLHPGYKHWLPSSWTDTHHCRAAGPGRHQHVQNKGNTLQSSLLY